MRRLHAPTLDPLTHALERAEAAYASSAEGARIERATHAVAHRRAAVIGIEAFLGKDRSGESPEMANKQTSARAKLADARASLPLAERELADAVASSPLWRAREAARTAVTAEREATGLAAADADAREASTAGGNSLVTKGDDYEKTCADVVMAMLRDDPTGGTLGLDLGGSIGAEASSDKGAGLLLLRNVTLGLHSGELDCVLVRVNRESAFVDKIPQDGDGTTGRRTLIRRGRTRTADDEVEDEKKPPAAEVLAVFEFKRNPDDVARGFHSRQTTLGWLAGDERSYDAGEWRNRRHPSGHFNRGYHPMKATSWVSAEKFPETSGCDQKGRRAVVLTRDSFRGFRRHGGFYLDGVWLVTRPRTMCGLDAKVSRERDCFFGFWFGFLVLAFSSSPSSSSSAHRSAHAKHDGSSVTSPASGSASSSTPATSNAASMSCHVASYMNAAAGDQAPNLRIRSTSVLSRSLRLVSSSLCGTEDPSHRQLPRSRRL